MPQFSDLHIPLGGPRYRPCLEDLLEFLIVEFGLDKKIDRARPASASPQWNQGLGQTDRAPAVQGLRFVYPVLGAFAFPFPFPNGPHKRLGGVQFELWWLGTLWLTEVAARLEE